MKVTDIPGISKLSKHEKILLAEDLWEEIAADDSDIAVPDSHKRELTSRLDKQLTSPGKLLTLEELQANLEMRK